MNNSAHNFLVVIESIAIRKMLASRLAKTGASIAEESSGIDALQRLREERFDLVFADSSLSELDGPTLTSRIKNDHDLNSIPVIIINTLGSSARTKECFDAGAAAVLTQTGNDTDLEKIITQILNESKERKVSKVFIVDDSVTIVKLAEAGLRKSGFEVSSAENGAEALEKLKFFKPDLIISDLDMPVMDGMEFCKRLSEDPLLKEIPFMIMSANSEQSVMRKMIAEGASAYMVKPFHTEQFVITVEKLLTEQFRMLNAEKKRLELEQHSMLSTITALINALEARDPYTSGHSRRVSEYSMAIAKVMGMPKDDLEILKIGSRLHDVGKIGIPDGMLLKPGKLTDEEIAKFNHHPTIGASILNPVPSLEKMIPIVELHHERIDGQGYPRKMPGAEIPLMARICAVADCYDALTSDRPYRKGFAVEKAWGIIEEIRGSQLCEECVDAFFKWTKIHPTGLAE
ncbi:MAG: response regulator [SAR324 cluster bacterium]|nr:response regulator [SAR324 cluster bacterium]